MDNLRHGPFGQSFMQFAWDRIESSDITTLQDPKYVKIRDEHNASWEKFKSMLSPEAFKLYMDEVEPMESEMESFHIEQVYLQGLKDGIELKKIIGLVS